MVGAPAPAPAEMWEPGVGVGVAMTTEGRGFCLKAFPSLNTGRMSKYPLPNAPPIHVRTPAPPRGLAERGGRILRAVPSPTPICRLALLPSGLGRLRGSGSPLRPLSDLCVSDCAPLFEPRNFSFGAGMRWRAGSLGVSLSPMPPEP